MTGIQISQTTDSTVINIPNSSVPPEAIIALLHRLRFQELIIKGDFDESIDDIGEDIKAEWWAKNKEKFLRIEA
jgi:hypothetical protein